MGGAGVGGRPGSHRPQSMHFWILDDSFFDTPQLNCCRLPEQGAFTLSLQPVLTMGALDTTLFRYLTDTNERLHFTSILSMFIYCAIMVINTLAVLFALENTGCDKMLRFVIPRECYFLMLYVFCFVLVRAGVLKTYVMQPLTAMYQLFLPTPTELISLGLFGSLLVVFTIHVALLHATVSGDSYEGAISLTGTGLISGLAALFAFGVHVRSFTCRRDHPELKRAGTDNICAPAMFVNATSLAHLVHTQPDDEPERKERIQALSVLVDNNQSFMLTVSVLILTLNNYALLYAMLQVPDSCMGIDMSVEIRFIVEVQSLFLPLVMFVYAVIRVFLLKAQVARPIATCFNLKKSSDYSYSIMAVLWTSFLACYIFICYMYRYGIHTIDHHPYWIVSFSLLALICCGLCITVYSVHCNGLVMKVLTTYQHSYRASQEAAAETMI